MGIGSGTANPKIAALIIIPVISGELESSGMGHAPWERWSEARRIEHYNPISPNVIYMPAGATNGKSPLDITSLLVRVIGETTDDAPIAAFIKRNWKPRGTFRVTKVNHQSFKIGFHVRQDFERLQSKRWGFLEHDLILVRIWKVNENTIEDTLDTIPQKALIQNIPEALWGDEAIGRIASALGKPLDIRARRPSQPHSFLPSSLDVCVIVDCNFKYPATLRIRLEGNEGVPTRDTIINVEYEQRKPYCSHCRGFGH